MQAAWTPPAPKGEGTEPSAHTTTVYQMREVFWESQMQHRVDLGRNGSGLR